jgi:sulfoxide reductase heme-binding subunit YedZ
MLIWYLARGAGITAFATLSLATAAGALTARRSHAVQARVITQYVHRSAALTGVLLLGLHLLMVLLDSYAKVGLAGAVLPLASSYRPVAVTLGLLSMYLLVMVTVSGLLRSRFAASARGARLWRGIHLASYGAWALSAWHFLLAGTDAGQWWARLVLLAGLGLVGTGLAIRLSDPAPAHRTQAPIAAGARR